MTFASPLPAVIVRPPLVARPETAGDGEPDCVPLFFGPPQGALFGCHHRPPAGAARRAGVVLCGPIGQESIRAHRAFKQLAVQLARSGFDCLRFDWYGSGDSAGDDGDGGIERWRNDAASAIRLLRSRCGVETVALVGLRLGASLAALTAVDRSDVDSLVMWDPVVAGGAYVDDLVAGHRARLRAFPAPVKLPSTTEPPAEALGFALPAALRSNLAALDLAGMVRPPAPRILVVDTRAAAALGPLRDRLSGLGARVDLAPIDTPSIWIEDLNKVLVPHAVLKAITTWIDACYP